MITTALLPAEPELYRCIFEGLGLLCYLSFLELILDWRQQNRGISLAMMTWLLSKDILVS